MKLNELLIKFAKNAVVLVLMVSTVRAGNGGGLRELKKEFSCNPSIDCANSSPSDLVPDPLDCYKYYICIQDIHGDLEPSDVSLMCPDGEYFSQDYGICVEDSSEFGCDNKCINRGCNSECSSFTGEYIAIPEVCDRYYVCDSSEEMVETSCPESAPYFDGTGCTVNEYKCCELCKPYCMKTGTETEDPMDCTKFYLCVGEQYTPGEDYHFSCPEGYYFEPLLGDCQLLGTQGCQTKCK